MLNFPPSVRWFLFFVLYSVILEAVHAQDCLDATYHQDHYHRQDVFIKEGFHFLKVPGIGTFTVYDIFDCTFECLSNPSCFSMNLDASERADGTRWCELLPSNKYINQDAYKENKSSHHYSLKGRFPPTSCVDYGRQGASKEGIYKIYDNDGNSFPAYCDLKSEAGTAWTLVMSWSTKNLLIPAFRNNPFHFNDPENEGTPNWDRYRLNLKQMRSLQAHSTHWRATCSYPTYGIDFRDYLRGNFEDFNIADFVGAGTCKKVEYINIRGHLGVNLTAPFWQDLYKWTLHTDSPSTHCQFKSAKNGAVSSEDNFGYYGNINSKFRCTQGPQSTTQYWFGAHI